MTDQESEEIKTSGCRVAWGYFCGVNGEVDPYLDQWMNPPEFREMIPFPL
jgi:hypothetical protein